MCWVYQYQPNQEVTEVEKYFMQLKQRYKFAQRYLAHLRNLSTRHFPQGEAKWAENGGKCWETGSVAARWRDLGRASARPSTCPQSPGTCPSPSSWRIGLFSAVALRTVGRPAFDSCSCWSLTSTPSPPCIVDCAPTREGVESNFSRTFFNIFACIGGSLRWVLPHGWHKGGEKRQENFHVYFHGNFHQIWGKSTWGAFTLWYYLKIVAGAGVS